MEIRKLTPHCGSEIVGVDVRSATDVEVARIKEATAQRCVAVIRGQNLTPEEEGVFARRMGDPLIPGNSPYDHHGVMPLVNNFTMGPGNESSNWHTDATHLANPPSFTMLSAETIPEIGGDTMWANQYMAYETLSATLKAVIEPLRMQYTAALYYREHAGDEPLEMSHPLVRVHAETGRRALYLSDRRFVAGIEGMSEAESRPLAEFLHRHSQQPEHVYRHHWQAGDFVIWDNRCALHYAIRDYTPATVRNLFRIMLTGERPISVAEAKAASLEAKTAISA